MNRKKKIHDKVTIFISMPMGKKKGIIKNKEVEIDFDIIHQSLILKYIPKDYYAFRIDDIKKSSNISSDVTIYLRESDICIFDLTFTNPNVFWEHGYRLNEKPVETAILIAQKNTELPFNISSYRVLFYDYFDESSWQKFGESLNQYIKSINLQKNFTEEVIPDEKRMIEQLKRATNLSQFIGIWNNWKKCDKLFVDPLLELGGNFFDAGRLSLAIEVLQRAYNEEPNEYEVARTYGWYLRKNGEYNLAEKFLKKALELNPDDVETLGMLGGLYKRKFDFITAFDYYAKAYKLNSDVNYILLNLGLLYELNNQNKENGNPYYQKILDSSLEQSSKTEDKIWYHLAHGESYLALGNVKQSIKDYKIAITKGATQSMVVSSAENIEFLLIPKSTRNLALELLTRILYPQIGKDINELIKVLEKFNIKDIDTQFLKKPPLIIHISDLHFGYTDNKKSSHRFGNGLYKKKLSSYLINEIKLIIKDRGERDGIFLIISGDITNTGHLSEFNEASQFIFDIKKETGINSKNIIVVPGNHDVNWALSKENKSYKFDNYINFINGVYENKLEQFFPRFNWNMKIDSTRPDPSDLLGIFYSEEYNLFIAAINSCTYEDEEHHFGLIDRKQLEEISKQLKLIDDNNLIKIAVLHHHVFPMDYRVFEINGDVSIDKSIVRDFSLVEEYLQKLEFDIILHGHKHNPALRETILYKEQVDTKNIIICGAGSTGASDKILPKHIDNHFQIIKILNFNRTKNDDFIEIKWKELEYTDIAEWKSTLNKLIVG